MRILACPDCGFPMVLKESAQFGKFYGCSRWPKCSCIHGAHQATGLPLGIPANKQTRIARRNAHEAFDLLWKGKPQLMSRSSAYKWLSAAMQQTNIHIAYLSLEECERVVLLSTEKYYELCATKE